MYFHHVRLISVGDLWFILVEIVGKGEVLMILKCSNINNKFLDDLIALGIVKDERIDYMESKKIMLEKITDINIMAQTFKSSIKFVEHKLDWSELIIKIDQSIQIKITSNCEVSESQNTNIKNNQEELLLKVIEQKTNIINDYRLFEKVFNSLQQTERKVLYYSFFEKYSDAKLMTSHLQFLSSATLTRLKKVATQNFVNAYLDEAIM